MDLISILLSILVANEDISAAEYCKIINILKKENETI